MVGHMKASSNDLSTYRRNLVEVGFRGWFLRLSGNSGIVAKGGKLLPKQVLLIGRIYRFLATESKRILFLSAPPASGKTHVICLVSADLAAFGVRTAVVVPSSELLHDFYQGLKSISHTPNLGIDILTMQAFLQVREDYEIALIDEAHNVRSGFELNQSIYRVLDISDLTPLVDSIVHDRKIRGMRVVTKIIDGEDKESLLKIVYSEMRYKWLKSIYRSRSKWIVAISSSPTQTILYMLIADPYQRRITANASTVLISATPLDDDELELYCGIEPTEVCRSHIPVEADSVSSSFYFAPNKRIEFAYGIELVCKLLAARSVRTLILLNRPVTYRRWFEHLEDNGFGTRMVGIVGGEGGKARLRKFSEFMSNEDSILLTNSTVFWEGINIKDLRLLIIAEEPNPRPNLIDVYNGRSWVSGRIMRSRMIQGVGRIGRMSEDDGICLILFPYKGDRVSLLDCDSSSIGSIIRSMTEAN